VFNIGIIGAGLIGWKRASAISLFKDCRVSAVADIEAERAVKLANEFNAVPYADWRRVIERKDINAVVVATFNASLFGIAVSALQAGKHVLCEKPLGTTSAESIAMIEASIAGQRTLKTGFNHRHHPAIKLAKEIFDKRGVGRLIFMRSRYGHGGRPGYGREWRADRRRSGGGELLDQGVHVVDLFRWFAGGFTEVYGKVGRYFWTEDVEDNAFALFEAEDGVTASMHTSWTQWKNHFSFEVYGRDGYLCVEGLGGSYGKEILRHGRRNPEGGPPEEDVYEFNEPDISWEDEWREFLSAIREGRDPLGSGYDGYEAMRLIEALYESSANNSPVSLVKNADTISRKQKEAKCGVP
jgi:predicted dehydrogenase